MKSLNAFKRPAQSPAPAGAVAKPRSAAPTPRTAQQGAENAESYEPLKSQFVKMAEVKTCAEFNIPTELSGFGLLPLAHPQWRKANRRVLFVIESLDSSDIKSGKLFSSNRPTFDGGKMGAERNTMIATFRNTISAAWRLYQEYLGINSRTETHQLPDFAMGVANFNAMRYFDTQGTQRINALAKCANRLKSIITEMKPTDVIFFGDTAASYFLPEKIEEIPFKRGWVYQAEVNGHKFYASSTLDLEPLYNTSGDDTGSGEDDASAVADLLYSVARDLCNGYARRLLHDLSYVKPQIRVVDTIEKFRKLMEMLRAFPATKPIGLDLEASSLEAYNTEWYTLQIAFSTNAAYFLPLWHKDTPFTEEELDEIWLSLKEFFSEMDPTKTKMLVGANIQFDLKVIRAQLKIPVMYHTAWDVTAGEIDLDENIAIFNRLKFRLREQMVKTTLGNLKNMACKYGNDQYFKMSFSKEQRMTFGTVNIMTDVPAQYYACLDAAIVVGIQEQQCYRAEMTRIDRDHNYYEMFWTHVTQQMSNTVHAISHMHQHGSHVDVPYLRKLGDPKTSPLVSLMKETEEDLRRMDAVAETNRRMCARDGVRSNDMFGKAVDLFSMTKGDGLKTLVFEVMGLKPLAYSKETKKPKLDKFFIAEYAPLHPEVDRIKTWRATQKLLGTYVNSWLEKVLQSADGAIDHALRASFAFFIVTGRLSSFDPNLQQVPSRGSLAKHIKLMFHARKGRMGVGWDFQASEVRWSGILANDLNIRDAFLKGDRLRRQLVAEPDPEKIKVIKKLIKTEGDVHVQNVHRFFGQWVDKNHPLRSAVKGITFGVNY